MKINPYEKGCNVDWLNLYTDKTKGAILAPDKEPFARN